MSTEKIVAEKPIVADDAAKVVTREIQTDEAAKAAMELIEVCRNMNSTLDNKMDALIAAQAAANRRPVVDDRQRLDDVDVQMARSIHDLNDGIVDGQLGRDILKVSNRLYIDWELNDVRRAKQTGQPTPPIQKNRYWPLYEKMLKRADVWNTLTQNEGQEWAPIGVSTQTVELGRLPAKVPMVFPQIPIRKMRTMYVPVMAGAAAVRAMSQFTDTTKPNYSGTTTVNNPTIGQIGLTPLKHATDPAFINMELLEDSPVAVVDVLVNECATALSHGWESTIINGQSTGDAGNLDGSAGPLAARDMYNGLRYYCIVTNAKSVDAGGGTATYPNFVSAMKLMGFFAMNLPNVVAIFSPKIVFDITSDFQSNMGGILTSFQQMGPGAMLPRGTIAMLHGIPIIPTVNIPNMLATGKVSGTPAQNLFTFGCLVDTSRWRVGVAREIEVKVVDVAMDDAVGVRGFSRHAFNFAPPNTDSHVAAIRNVAA